jgi:hypothetical protein
MAWVEGWLADNEAYSSLAVSRKALSDIGVVKVDIWIAALLSLIAGLIFYPFAAIGLDPHHDGIMLKPALDVLSGQVLHRDSFSQYGPLTTYLHALALAVQPALLSLRLLTVAANAASLFFLYLSWRVLLPRSLSLVASVFFIGYAQFTDPWFPLIPWSSVLALLFQSAAVFCLMRLVAGSAGESWPWGLGVAVACTLWCRQPVGIFLGLTVATIAIALHFTGWKSPVRQPWLKAGAAFGAVSVLILGHLAFHGALGAWWEQTILWPKRWAAGYNEAVFWTYAKMFIYPKALWVLLATLLLAFLPAMVRRFRPDLPRWADFAWLALLGVIYIAFARRWVGSALGFYLGGWDGVLLMVIAIQAAVSLVPVFLRRTGPARSFDREYYASATLTGLAVGSALQIYPLPEPNHLYWALAPGLGVFFYFCHRALRLSAVGCSLAFLLLMMPGIWARYRWGAYNLSQPAVTLAEPLVLRGLRVKPAQAEALGRTHAAIKSLLDKNPGYPVMLYGDDALYLTLFNNLENPSPYYVNWPDLAPDADQRKRLDYLFRMQPIVLLNGKGARQLSFIPAHYEIGPVESELDLRIAVPGRLRAAANRESGTAP